MYLLLITGCENNSYYYEIKEEKKLYAYNLNNNNIELVYVDYEIEEPNDIFYLLTTYQNYLPIGYNSCCYKNV